MKVHDNLGNLALATDVRFVTLNLELITLVSILGVCDICDV